MSKKDYELIAVVLREAWETNERALQVYYESKGHYARYESRQNQVDDIIRDLAVALAADNPRFDRKKFIKAAMGGE